MALASIRALDGPDLAFEIIIADGARGAATEALAREFRALVVRPTSAGAAASRNAGLRAATGEFIAFLDDDDVWLPGHLRPHLALLRANPRIHAVVSQIRNGDQSLSSFGPAWPKHLREGEDAFHSFYKYFPQIGATVVRASVLDSVGYQDESLRGSEDWDWQLRLALSHPVAFIPVPSVGYRMRPAGTDDELIVLRVREHRRVFWSNVRSAGRRRPPPQAVLLAWSKHRGEFASYLIDSAEAQFVSGDIHGARRALRGAFRVSPPHCVKLLVTRPRLRKVIMPARLIANGRQV
jgi:glycosyltransferase involved in cell wall biosynthesis